VTRHFPPPRRTDPGGSLFGAAPMQSGLVLPLDFPDTLWILEDRAEGERKGAD